MANKVERFGNTIAITLDNPALIEGIEWLLTRLLADPSGASSTSPQPSAQSSALRPRPPLTPQQTVAKESTLLAKRALAGFDREQKAPSGAEFRPLKPTR